MAHATEMGIAVHFMVTMAIFPKCFATVLMMLSTGIGAAPNAKFVELDGSANNATVNAHTSLLQQ